MRVVACRAMTIGIGSLGAVKVPTRECRGGHWPYGGGKPPSTTSVKEHPLYLRHTSAHATARPQQCSKEDHRM